LAHQLFVTAYIAILVGCLYKLYLSTCSGVHMHR